MFTDHVLMNFLNFCLSEKVFISLSLLKVDFTAEFECSGFCFFFPHFISLQFLLACMVSDEKSTITLFFCFLSFYLVYILSHVGYQKPGNKALENVPLSAVPEESRPCLQERGGVIKYSVDAFNKY